MRFQQSSLSPGSISPGVDFLVKIHACIVYHNSLDPALFTQNILKVFAVESCFNQPSWTDDIQHLKGSLIHPVHNSRRF